MSDTTSKRKDDDSPTSQVVNADDDELDDDLDNALFGDDEDGAEPAEADADAKAEVAPVTGGVTRRSVSCFVLLIALMTKSDTKCCGRW